VKLVFANLTQSSGICIFVFLFIRFVFVFFLSFWHLLNSLLKIRSPQKISYNSNVRIRVEMFHVCTMYFLNVFYITSLYSNVKSKLSLLHTDLIFQAQIHKRQWFCLTATHLCSSFNFSQTYKNILFYHTPSFLLTILWF
jgi:hypothetical protein